MDKTKYAPVDLDLLFSEFLHPASQIKAKLLETLHQSDGLHLDILAYPNQFNISALKAQYKQQANYLRVFPSVFIPIETPTNYIATWLNKFQLKYAKLAYSVDEESHIELKTLCYTKVSLVIQMLIYLSNSEQANSSQLNILKPSHTADYLAQHLGATFSQGQLIDFVDRLYDQYKHTQLPPHTFRLLFRCFGSLTPTIANAAFGYYMKLRNTKTSWQLAVSDYLETELSLPKVIAEPLSKLLIDEYKSH